MTFQVVRSNNRVFGAEGHELRWGITVSRAVPGTRCSVVSAARVHVSTLIRLTSANFGRSALLSIAVIGRCRGCRYVFSASRNDPPGADAVISDQDLLLDPLEPLIRRKRPHRTRPFIPRFRNYCRDSQLQGDREDCLAGGHDYVTKPIRVDALVEALMQATPRGAA